MKCTIHNRELTMLFTSARCDECDGVVTKPPTMYSVQGNGHRLDMKRRGRCIDVQFSGIDSCKQSDLTFNVDSEYTLRLVQAELIAQWFEIVDSWSGALNEQMRSTWQMLLSEALES